jgi:single-strand DNA-binding protein
VAGRNINRVIVTGNLTREPEMRSTSGGMAVCSLRIAVNGSRKDESGNWIEEPNYFNVTIFGRQGETAAQYLSKGRAVAVDGRLRWREYTDKDNNKREAIEIVADTVQFLSSPDGGQGGGGNGFTARTDVPADESDFVGAPAGGGSSAPADDDIPF